MTMFTSTPDACLPMPLTMAVVGSTILSLRIASRFAGMFAKQICPVEVSLSFRKFVTKLSEQPTSATH
jgi:hypothetical protein